jgi:hypothetical protein
VAAFRNNALDYKAFYIQGDDAKLSPLLRDHLPQAHQKFSDAQVFDIRREINLAGNGCGGCRGDAWPDDEAGDVEMPDGDQVGPAHPAVVIGHHQENRPVPV